MAVFARRGLCGGRAAAAAGAHLATVLERTAAYVAEFYRRLSGIVAEEHYLQNWYSVRRPAEKVTLSHRELRSDLVLIRPPGEASWTELRDVFEVDGRPIRNRTIA
jgi:hypothetical protein